MDIHDNTCNTEYVADIKASGSLIETLMYVVDLLMFWHFGRSGHLEQDVYTNRQIILYQ